MPVPPLCHPPSLIDLHLVSFKDFGPGCTEMGFWFCVLLMSLWHGRGGAEGGIWCCCSLLGALDGRGVHDHKTASCVPRLLWEGSLLISGGKLRDREGVSCCIFCCEPRGLQGLTRPACETLGWFVRIYAPRNRPLIFELA